MNRTQKGAWFGLVVPCFPVVWYICVGTLTHNLQLKLSIQLTFMPILVFLLLFPVVMFFVIGKKQSPAEVASDERDYMIRAKALLAGYISVLAMLVVLCTIMVLASNDELMVPALSVIPFSLLIFLISIAVYSIAILVQYGREGKSYE
jgi:hypothetical protein